MDFGANEEGKDNRKKKKNNNRDAKKIIKVSIGVGLFLLLIVTMWLYTNNENVKNFFDIHVFRKEVYEDTLPTIIMEVSDAEHVYMYGKDVLVLEHNKLKGYSKLGHEAYSVDLKVTTPLFDSEGDFLCVADKNGESIYLISGRNIVWQKELEGDIYNICVNKNGYVAVTTTDTSYKAIVQTYDKNGNELFKTFLGTSNVIDIDISSDNKYLAIAEVNLTGIIIQSYVKIISMEMAKKEPNNSIAYRHMSKPDDLIINIEYNNKDNLICMYDTHVDSIQKEQNREIDNYSDTNTLFMDINLNSNIVKVIKKSSNMFNGKAEMQIINIDNPNENKIIYEVDKIPKSVHTYKNMICLNTGTEILFINNKGWLMKRYKSTQEAKNIVIGDGIASIVYKSKIEIINL